MTRNAPAIWADLIYSDGHTVTVKGFAMAWTSGMVEIQWVEFSRARHVWVNASDVRRRQLKDRRPTREG